MRIISATMYHFFCVRITFSNVHFIYFGGKSALHCGNGESAKSGFKIVTQLTFHIHGFFRFQYVTFIGRFLIGVATQFWFYFPFLCE